MVSSTVALEILVEPRLFCGSGDGVTMELTRFVPPEDLLALSFPVSSMASTENSSSNSTMEFISHNHSIVHIVCATNSVRNSSYRQIDHSKQDFGSESP